MVKKSGLILSFLFFVSSCSMGLSKEPQPISPLVETKFTEVLPENLPTFTPTLRPTSSTAPKIYWITDSEVSWYGPGFYGHRTACGQAYTTAILGVAHRTLPCGTMVMFKYNNKEITVPVIDRGPYVTGRIWDLSGGLCTYLNHCFTGPIQYYIIK